MPVSHFYDTLAPYYHLIYEDWNASIERQSAALDTVIRSQLDSSSRSVLDVACGVGTQSLGLAARGYEVVGSDISTGAIDRARSEASRRQLGINFSVADMRAAHDHHPKEFDVVLCADNSLPHLLSDREILGALRQFYLCTRPGGLCVVSLRDYAALEQTGVQFKPYGVRRDGPTRYVLFQVWQWRGAHYDLSFYFVRDEPDGTCHTDVARSTYYAIPISKLVALMENTGFTNVRRIDDKFFQPLIVAARPSGG